MIGLIDDVMRNAERMRHSARVGYSLWPTAFVLRARDTILRPHFHRDADHLIALFAQQVTGDAGVHSTAHTEKNTLFSFVHSL